MPNSNETKNVSPEPKGVSTDTLRDDMERHLIDAWRRDAEEADADSERED